MTHRYIATGANGHAIAPKDAEIQAALLTLERAIDNEADAAAAGTASQYRNAKADTMRARLAAIAEYVERVEL